MWNNLFQKIERTGLKISIWVGIISALITVIGWILSIYKFKSTGFFTQFLEFFQGHYQLVWLLTLSFILFFIGLQTSRLNKKFILGFKDKFDGNIGDNWDFKGPWRILEKGTLIVTGSDEGGITKTGALWENYTFSFKAKIINECLGIIVRAQDLNNYYMFQIRKDKINPHRRITLPFINEIVTTEVGAKSIKLSPVNNLVVWQTPDNTKELESSPISPQINDWFTIKIKVKGQSIYIYLNEQAIYQRQDLLLIPTGKVGFRNDGREEAYIKDVSVLIDPIN